MHGTACFIPDCRPCRLPKWQNTSDCQGPPSLSNIWCLHTCGVGDRAWSAGPYRTHGTYRLCSWQGRAEDRQEWQYSTPEKYKLTEQCTPWGTSCLEKTQSRYWHSAKVAFISFSYFKEASYSRVPAEISLHVSIFPILVVLEIHFMVYRSSHKSNLSISRPCKFPLCPMKPKEAIFLNREGWNSCNMRQAAPEDAQKSKNLLYLVSLKWIHSTSLSFRNNILWECSHTHLPIYISCINIAILLNCDRLRIKAQFFLQPNFLTIFIAFNGYSLQWHEIQNMTYTRIK